MSSKFKYSLGHTVQRGKKWFAIFRLSKDGLARVWGSLTKSIQFVSVSFVFFRFLLDCLACRHAPSASCLHQSPDALHQCAAALPYISAGPLTSIMPPLPVHQHAFTYQPQNTQRTNCNASIVPQPQSTLSPGARLALGGLFSALQIENQSRCGKPASHSGRKRKSLRHTACSLGFRLALGQHRYYKTRNARNISSKNWLI